MDNYAITTPLGVVNRPPAKKAPAKKAPAKKAPAKKAVPVSSRPSRPPAKKAPAKKAVPVSSRPSRPPAKKAPARKAVPVSSRPPMRPATSIPTRDLMTDIALSEQNLEAFPTSLNLPQVGLQEVGKKTKITPAITMQEVKPGISTESDLGKRPNLLPWMLGSVLVYLIGKKNK